MKRNQRENESFKILDKVVEHAETFWVRRLGNIHQRADFRGLRKNVHVNKCALFPTTPGLETYFKGDMFIPKSDFEFLSSVLVLLGPLGIVFPVSH